MPEAAQMWLESNYETLPRDCRPAREDLRAFANLFASYLESSFDLIESPGRQLYSPDAHCFCPCCSWFVDAPRLKTKKLLPRDKARAKDLQLAAIADVAREEGLELRDAEHLLSDQSVYEASALVAYGCELERRMNDAGSGPTGLALWRAFAWTREGSPRRDYELTAERILDGAGLIVNALRGNYGVRPGRVLTTASDALGLLAALGATEWLVRHHELVLEAAEMLCPRIERELVASFDRRLVLLGAALHDAGKIVHPEEMHERGAAHELAGERLLLEHGVEPSIARFCVTHAAWADGTIEDMLVALADKLWKGKRDEALELALAEHIVATRGGDRWAAISRLDSICEAIADDGSARLARSAV